MPLTIPPEVRTWAEIDLSAIRHNAGVARQKVGAGCKLIGVVKANAYGHGMAQAATALADLVAGFGVASLPEAQELAKLNLDRDILLLSPCLPAERKPAVEAGFICSISSAEEAEAFAQSTNGRKALLNFKIDTGMGRMGCWQDDAEEHLKRILKIPNAEVRTIATHLPVADEDEAFTSSQLARFEALAERLTKVISGTTIQCLNSGGILAFPGHGHHLARAGLMLYGSAYPKEFQSLLKPALSWKARVILVRDVGEGRGINYGRTFITPKPMRVANLPVGYADGFPRQVSGQGAQVLIGGKRCAVLGRVTMDQIVADVSDVPEVQLGDEAVIIGRQGGEEIFASELADWAGTISWDIFTGIKSRVTKFYY